MPTVAEHVRAGTDDARTAKTVGGKTTLKSRLAEWKIRGGEASPSTTQKVGYYIRGKKSDQIVRPMWRSKQRTVV